MTDIDDEAGPDVPEGEARCGIAALVGRLFGVAVAG